MADDSRRETRDREERQEPALSPVWLWAVGGGIVVLAGEQLVYALVPRSCEWSLVWPLHLSAAVSLALCLWAAFVAWRRMSANEDARLKGGSAAARTRFLGVLGVGVNGISALLVLLQWLAIFIIGPCMFS